jgi:ABC-type transport system involved in cytochrome c biogenesis permease subunit
MNNHHEHRVPKPRELAPWAFLSAIALLASSTLALDVSPLRTLPVLDHGRVKPIDTVARESIQFITGKESFGLVTVNSDGQQEVTDKRDSLDLALDIAAHPIAWQTQPVLYVPLLDLRAKLGMKESQKWISARAIMDNTDFTAWVRGLEEQQMKAEQDQETVFLTPVETAAIELDSRLKMFEAASDLSLYPILPVDGAKSDSWMPISNILTLSGQDAQIAKPIQTALTALLDSYRQSDNAAFAAASAQLQDQLRQLVGGDYADMSRINREVFYNSFKPFRWTWVIYFIAVISLIAALMSRRKMVYVLAMSIFAAAILFHGGAFALRCSITGWAPVTNMYETVIWVAMMGAIFSYVLELVYRQRTIAIGGAVVALLATVVADNMPVEFGNNIRNLTPVLRSNYWLTIHVLTIVSSYAAFALALVLGNILLGQYIYGKTDPAVIRTNLLFTYRAVQIGVLLVAAGTILGGLWADVSWGRFWGWDPKEVWALIVLLTYLALLHGRYAGWIRQFGFAAGAVICFTAVVMSWYGVNFVLGAGLHSYGFNTGGQGYVFTAVGIQWAFVLIAWLIHRGRQAAARLPTAEEPDLLPRAYPVTGK